MAHPFADLIDLQVLSAGPGHSELALAVAPAHLSPRPAVAASG